MTQVKKALAQRVFYLALLVGSLLAEVAAQNSNLSGQFMSLDDARPVLHGLQKALPTGLRNGSGPLSQETWNDWIREEDAIIRKRLETGEEDTLTNLLRFGVTYTKEYRIDREYLTRYGQSSLVNSFADNRANDLILALRSPTRNAGMQEMRLFLERKGFSFNSASERAKLKKYLLNNLARMRDEFVAYSQTIENGKPGEASELYSSRGISLDSNLWPDHAIDQTLQKLMASGVLTRGSIHRIGVVGPGLDFANKELGNDYYPPQTIQPFAVLDSLIRLGLTDADNFQLTTMDISPSVNIHVARIKKTASRGKPYTLQLVWNASVPRDKAYLASFEVYWHGLGGQIGDDVPAIAPPPAVASELNVRAIRVRPAIVTRVSPSDMNIVFERLTLTADQKFDLIIGTNIFVYYSALEQSLARSNLAAMLRPGGYLITNELLNDVVPSGLSEISRSRTEVSTQPRILEWTYCYQREKKDLR
jgi:hypothetical protein